jgi:hypothetical protein
MGVAELASLAWILALASYGVLDLATTFIGLRYFDVVERNDLARDILDYNGFPSLVLFKGAVVASIYYALLPALVVLASWYVEYTNGHVDDLDALVYLVAGTILFVYGLLVTVSNVRTIRKARRRTA